MYAIRSYYAAKFEINGQELILETGRMAKQANGAVIVRFGGSYNFV